MEHVPEVAAASDPLSLHSMTVLWIISLTFNDSFVSNNSLKLALFENMALIPIYEGKKNYNHFEFLDFYIIKKSLEMNICKSSATLTEHK